MGVWLCGGAAAGRRDTLRAVSPQPIGRDKAWTLLLTNALVLPGLGSFLAGRRWAGALQAATALLGFALTVVWLWSYAAEILRLHGLPEGLGPHTALGLAGLLVFLVSWAWSLGSGLAILREATGPR